MHQFSNAGFTNNTNNTFVNSPMGMSSSTQTTAAISNSSNNNSNNNSNNSHANDFNLEFLEGLPGDQNFAQDFLSSLDAASSNFNINDIL